MSDLVQAESSSLFADYARAGWALCPLRPGTKSPNAKAWRTTGAIRTPDRAGQLKAAGLVHELSGTCAIDFDDLSGARAWLAGQGIDMDALLGDPSAVRIESGKTNRAKLLYRLPQGEKPLRLHRVRSGQAEGPPLFELRCAGAQDVLPPSVHPETSRPYTWSGDWRSVPELPAPLLALWHQLISGKASTEQPAPTAAKSLEVLRMHLAALRKSAKEDRGDWVRVGMAVHHETQASPDGLALWDEWSSTSSKYDPADLVRVWESFGKAADRPLATLRSLAALVDHADPACRSAWEAVAADDFERVNEGTGERARPRFKLVPFAEFIQRPAPAWRVDGLLPETGLAMLYGAPAVGKSFLAVDLAISIAAGVPWHGYKVRPGKAVYIAAEGVAGIAQRMRACAAHRGVDPLALPLAVLDGGVDMLKSEWQPLAQAILDHGGTDLIVFDTLAQVSAGADENTSEGMGRVIQNCQRLQQATGGLVLLVHHPGKDETRGERGWSGLRGALDASLQVVRPAGGPVREMRVTKMKEGQDGAKFSFSLESVVLGQDAEGRELTTCVVVPSAAAAAATRAPKGKWPGLAWEEFLALSAPLGAMSFEALISATAARGLSDPAGSRDRRREYATRAIETLQEQGFVRIDGSQVRSRDDFDAVS